MDELLKDFEAVGAVTAPSLGETCGSEFRVLFWEIRHLQYCVDGACADDNESCLSHVFRLLLCADRTTVLTRRECVNRDINKLSLGQIPYVLQHALVSVLER